MMIILDDLYKDSLAHLHHALLFVVSLHMCSILMTVFRKLLSVLQSLDTPMDAKGPSDPTELSNPVSPDADVSFDPSRS